jgi:uncharacterized Zn-finger protein
MNVDRLVNNQWFNRIVLAIWVISAVCVMFLLTRIDLIVHGQLYNFGLQFDPAWADPYWSYTRLIYVGLGLPMTLSVFFIALGFASKIDKAPERATKQEPKPQPVVCEKRKAKEKNNSMVISCPSCKKVFGRPLVMLNFEGGKTRLVNVCPYCNHVLGSADDGKSSESDAQIADMDEKLTH